MSLECDHLMEVQFTRPKKHVCEDCVRIGDSWIHLRMCLTCGQVGCCDSSKNKHARKHFQRVGHPLIRSIEPGEGWVWCYIDQFEVAELAA
jgi:uncharacterized UBP type Zn finger protein